MTMESHGGVADQITNLALELPQHGVSPIVLVRNPLARNHAYAAILTKQKITIWAVTDSQYRAIRRFCELLCKLALPVVMLDSFLRQRTRTASQQSLWGVLRHAGYLGLDSIFWLRLATARIFRRARIVHFRKPDGWRKVPWAKKLGFGTIYTEETLVQPHTRHYYEDLARVMSSLDAVTAVSQASADSIQPYCGLDRSISVIGYMVNDPSNQVALSSRELDPIAVGCLARLDPEKDLGTLLLGMSLALEKRSDLRLTIYGDGPMRAELNSQAQSLGLDRSVTFGGVFAKPDLPRIMVGLDIVVLTSLWEGLPVSLIEAIAFGKPVIATDVGGVREIIVNDRNGFMIPPRSPEALAEAIIAVASDKHLYDRMAQAGREHYLTHFTPEGVVPQYVALYERLAA